MIKQRKKPVSSSFFRLFAPVMVLLIPLLVLGGNVSTASPPLPQKPSDTAQTLVLRVYFHDTAERDRLATELNAEEMPTTSGYLTVIADRSQYNSIIARGLRVEIDEASTAQMNNPNLFGHDNNPDTFDGGYRTVEEMQTFLDQYVALYPTLAVKVNIGSSWCMLHAPCVLTNPSLTWSGYNIWALHITNQAIAGPKPVFWYDAGIHAREIATPEIAMRYIQWLLDGYNSDPDAHWLVDYQDIWVVPMVNPDGHHMDEYNGNPAAIGQRKNADYNNGCTVWGNSGSQLGTDNNRNFPFKWNCCGGSSGNACDQTFRGPSSNSDPETQAIVNQVRLLIPDQRGPNDQDPAPITTTGIYQNMHSNASLDLYPWGWTMSPSPNNLELANLGQHLSAANASPPGNSYQACQAPNCLYSVDGAANDWAYGDLGAAGFTTEIGGSSFYPPYSTIDSSLWPQNRGALIYQAKMARMPYLMAHGPDTSAVATNPITVTQGTPSQLSATINFAWTGNSLSQNVGAAEYYIDTPPWAGGTAIPMTGNFNSPTVPVQATIDTTSLSIGRHVIFVRGRGVNDYMGYQTWGEVTAAWLWVTPSGGTPTATSSPATTNTPAPATNTPTRTSTSVPPTTTGQATSTYTAAPTNTATRTNTPLPTQTPGGFTATPQPTNTNTPIPPSATPAATNTPGVPTATPTACTLSFTDVPSGSTFYPFIRCLACKGIINGYSDGTFRPGNDVTRGQLSKIVSNSAGFSDTPSGQQYQDVPVGSTFYVYIYRLASRGFINGYPCGAPPAGPCVPPGNLPYFLPNANSTRGQISKIVSNAAGFNEVPTGQQFQDVPPSSPFYAYIYRLVLHNVMSGYPCGVAPAGACVPPGNLPYFLPSNNATRGQTSKIVANTFFPDCNPPGR